MLDKGNVYAKQTAHFGIASVALSNNKPHIAIENLKEYKKLNDSIQLITNTELVARMNALYNYHLYESKAKESEMSSQRRGIMIAILSLVLCGILLCIYYYVRYSKQEQRLLKLKIEKYEHLKEHWDKLEPKVKEENKQKIENAEIYRKVKRIVNCPLDSSKLTDEDWKSLEELVNNLYPQFTEKLFDLCKMNLQELHICLLLKIQINPSAISVLTNRSKEAITASRRRLYKKAFHQDGSPQNWDMIISSL